jgi:hypothetical protein
MMESHGATVIIFVLLWICIVGVLLIKADSERQIIMVVALNIPMVVFCIFLLIVGEVTEKWWWKEGRCIWLKRGK